MNHKRFSDILGEDYRLFKLAVPHHDELQRCVGEQTSTLVSASKPPLILEGGAGTGITTSELLRANPTAHVLAVDNEEVTFHQARRVLGNESKRVTFVHSDLLEYLLSLDSHSVDVFASAWTLHNFTPKYRSFLFTEIARTLKPGGVFVNGDKYALNSIREHKRSLQKQIKQFGVFECLGRSDLKEEWIKHYLEDEEVKITESEQKSILKELGFTNIETTYRKGMEAIIVAQKQN